jgi:hypothetical protein
LRLPHAPSTVINIEIASVLLSKRDERLIFI